MTYPTHKITLTVVDDGKTHWDLSPKSGHAFESVYKEHPAIVSVEKMPEPPIGPGDKVTYVIGAVNEWTVVAAKGDKLWLTDERSRSDRLEMVGFLRRVKA